jgi:hypothetical protein
VKPLAVPDREGPGQVIDGVYGEHIERIFWLLREKLPRVLEANRFFEEQTGFHNEAGRNNLVDALSHLATLVEDSSDLTFERQGEQVALLEDHLRRSMMEAFEQVLKLRLGEFAGMWAYYTDIVPERVRLRNPELPTEDEVDRARRRIAVLMERGRAAKRETTWHAWEAGTHHLVEACGVLRDLEWRVERGIYAAEDMRRQSRARAFLFAFASLLAALGTGVALGSLL